ncbi:alpha/beta fold hydrolase [Zhihengliuella sp.]|uniref:alpha/beta fold hydrolase n=1 Tax=Zhihengliuella sp. TaxID=1954483 RepID=UPI002811E44B|nr:alpha/beta fold hydrolase [Zhihengliuella sp.]
MSPRRALVSTHELHGATVRCWTYPGSADAVAAGRARRLPPPEAVVAVHGFRGDHHGLARLIEALPETTFVVPDLPGFGSSTEIPEDSPHRHDIDGYAAVLSALVEDLAIGDHAVLLGHSFGSIVAAAHAAASPHRWSGLILINPISEPALEGSEAVLSRLAHLFYRCGEALPAPIGERLLRWRLVTDVMSLAMTKSRDRATRDYVREQHRRYFGGFTSRRALLEAFGASISCTVRDYAASIPLPTLLVAGALDELGSPASQRALADLFPDARLRMIDGVGHLIHYEAAPAAASLVRGFLAGAPHRASSRQRRWRP